jgi:hypothetical protein
MMMTQELIEALRELQKQLRAHVKLDVRKHYSLMVADAAASTAIAKAEAAPTVQDILDGKIELDYVTGERIT